MIRVRLLLERRLNLLGSRKIASEMLSLVRTVFSKLADVGLELKDLFGKTLTLRISNWGFRFPGFNFRMILSDPAFGIVPAGLGIVQLRLVVIELLPLLVGKVLGESAQLANRALGIFRPLLLIGKSVPQRGYVSFRTRKLVAGGDRVPLHLNIPFICLRH